MDPSNGVVIPLPRDVSTADGLRHKKWDVCLIFGIPSWLMPLRDRSGQSSQPYWHGAQRPKFVQGSLECVENLAPLLPPSLPLFLFAFWGFPECNTQDLPSLSLVCPWTIVRSWEHLPFSPLPFSPSLFLSFSFSSLHPLPWASLDAFVIAGSPSFLMCPWTLVP